MTTEPTWREFDTLDGIDPRIKTEAFNQQKAIFEIVKHAGQLHSLLKDMIYHQSRMLEKWADGDDNVKNGLWKNLHDSGNKAREYLDSSEPTVNTGGLDGNPEQLGTTASDGLPCPPYCPKH